MGTLKPQSNKPLYSNTVIGTLAVDGWAVTCGTGMGGLAITVSEIERDIGRKSSFFKPPCIRRPR